MSETPQRRAQLSYGQIMMRQADQLATDTTATLKALKSMHGTDDDSGQALVKASAVLVAAVTSAKIIGSKWAAVRFGRDSFTPQIISDDEHRRLEGALSSVFDDGASPQALTSLTRNEIVRSASDAFAVESLDAIQDPSFDVDDAREDLEEIPEPEPEEDDDDDDLPDDDGESDDERLRREALEDEERERESAEESARYDREMEEYLDRMDREDEEDFKRWEAKQDAEYDAEERREAEEEKEKRKPKKLPPAPSESMEWAYLLINDDSPCGRCRLAHGRRIPDPDKWRGVHLNCGCTAVLSLTKKRLTGKPTPKKEKSS